jgi:hypothetical protein
MLTVKKVFNNYIVLIFIIAIFQVFAIYKFALKNSKDYFLTIYIFLSFGIYGLGLSAIRQFIALSFFLLGYKHIRDKKFLKFLVYIVIASLFHPSAIILIAIYPFINCNVAYKTKALLLIITGIICTILVSSGIYEQLLTKYVTDYTYKYANIGSELNSNYTVFLISLLLVIADFFLSNKKKGKRDKTDANYCYLLLLCLFAYLATLHATLGRTIIYFMPAVALFVPDIISGLKDGSEKKLFKLGVFAIFLLIYIL